MVAAYVRWAVAAAAYNRGWCLRRNGRTTFRRVQCHFVHVVLPEEPLEDAFLSASLQLPPGSPALIGRPGHLDKGLVQSEVVPHRVLPTLPPLEAVVGVAGVDVN